MKTLPVALLALAIAIPQAFAQESGLVSYEATYRLTLEKIDSTDAVITAKGAMGTRVRRDCSRWQSQTEMLFLLELDNGDKIRTHTMSRERESLDGQNIDFVYWEDVSGSGRLEYRGNATIPLNGDAGTVKYDKPKRYERKLPKGVEMPIAAMRQIVNSLVTDGTTPNHNYFDPRAKFVTVRSIGGDPIILAVPPKGDAHLVDGRSWRLRATPIPEGEDEKTQKDKDLQEQKEETYTMIQIHDTGVASYMEMKSGITTIKAELTDVRQLPPPDCSRPKPPEFELSKDCPETEPGAKPDGLAAADEPKEAATDGSSETAMDASPANGEEMKKTEKAADCNTTVRKVDPDAENVEAAPLGDVEQQPIEDGAEPTEPEAIVPTDPEAPESEDPLLTPAAVVN